MIFSFILATTALPEISTAETTPFPGNWFKISIFYNFIYTGKLALSGSPPTRIKTILLLFWGPSHFRFTSILKSLSSADYVIWNSFISAKMWDICISITVHNPVGTFRHEYLTAIWLLVQEIQGPEICEMSNLA